MKQSPLHVGPDDLLRSLRGNGGQTFTDFVDSLIRAEAALAGITPDEVVTNIRTTIADGGVDTRIKVPLHGALQLGAPSCWQYKATSYSEVTESTSQEEMRKPAAAERVMEGDVYCLCICDDAPAEWKERRRKFLLETAQALNPQSLEPRLFCAGELADWANRFPAVVVRFFRPQLELVLPHDAWLRKERAELPAYVEIAKRTEAVQRIRDHVDFRQSGRGVLAVAGRMGTGKSRLVAESIAHVSGLVLYVVDQANAVTLATHLVNDSTTSAVVVVDACAAATRLRLADLLRGSEDRVRAIAIYDSAQETTDVNVEVAALDEEDVRRVLEENFGDVPSSHRRAFAHLADGHLQIAAKLGSAYRNDRQRFVRSAAANAADVLLNHVRDEDDRTALQLVSMFHRIGYRGTVGGQLTETCRVLGIKATDVVDRCRRLGRVPGVVALGPRYVAVRPRLLVRPLLATAWTRWVADDVGAFIDRLPETMRVTFVKQVGAHGGERERDALVDWATPWLRTLTPADLLNAASVDLLLALVETSPQRVGPRLVALLRSASDDTVRAPGEGLRHGSTSTYIRWALRDLLSSRATYDLAEGALFRIASLEGDAGVAGGREDTATGTWAASFRIYLSGTEVPFATRLHRLAMRLAEAGSASVPHVLAALRLILDSHASRTEGLPLVAGELRPQEWRPRTADELDACLRGALEILGRCTQYEEHRARALDVLVRHGRNLLSNEMLDSLRAIVDGIPLDESGRVAVLGCVRDFIEYDCKADDDDGERGDENQQDEYVTRVCAWRDELQRNDVGGRLAEMIGATHWFDETPEWTGEVTTLAASLYEQRRELESRLSWLVTCEGNDTVLIELGRAIGKLDAEGELLEAIFEATARATNPLFPRGYVLGLAERHTHDTRLAAQIDRLESVAPSVAVDLSRMVPHITSPGQRAIRLARERRIEAGTLRHMLFFLKDGLLADAVEAILDVLANDPEAAAATGLAIVGPLAWKKKNELPEDARSMGVLWRLLEVAIPGAHAEAHSWGRVLRRCAEREFSRAVELCCRAVVGGDFSIQEEATKALIAFIGQDAELCLSRLGPMLLTANPWLFGSGRRATALNAFPVDLMRRWIEESGVSAARIIAASLPLPTLGADGSLFVHALTEFVLERFEEDEVVYERFAHGRSGQVYFGDIAGQHDAEAMRAAAFRTHPLRRIQQWAEEESMSARADAQYWREHHEERFDD